MSKYEVSNSISGHSFGVFEADTAEAAIAACCKEAGGADDEALEAAKAELVAVEVV